MFAKEEHFDNPVVKRLLSYWLITYGVARTAAGIPNNFEFGMDVVAAITYFIEAFCFEYEHRVGKTLVPSKVTFVSVFSFILGVLVLLRPFGVYGGTPGVCPK